MFPYWARHDRDELHEMIARFIGVNRPRAAFHVLHHEPKDVEPSVLARLLTEVATTSTEPPSHYLLQSYDIARALKALEGRLPPEQLAQLEFMYLSALDDDEHGIPHLENQLSEVAGDVHASHRAFVQTER